MTPPLRILPLARWSVAVAVTLMAAALLVTAWATYSSVREASATLIRGRANAFQQSLSAYLFQLGELPTSEQLADILQEESEAGLRYIALLEPRGDVLVEAGTALRPSRIILGLRSDEPRVVGNRIETAFGFRARRMPGPRGWMQRGGRGGARVLIQFEPVEAESLRSAAARTFGVGAVGATVLLLGALGLVRWALQREANERQREHDRRLASLGEMSAVLAHEIRNPLASLKGNAQLLAQMLPAGERQRLKAERVVDEAVRLESLTNDLLEYVRSGELRRSTVDPYALLRDAAASVASAEIEVHREAAAPAEWTLDADRIRQVLVNLLENAVQAGAPVKASVTLEQGRLVFLVQDAGPGIAEVDRERIFEPFFTRRTRGTGLGLSVAKRVVLQHGGTLSVQNVPGSGALFRVELPPKGGR